ncbi:MAG: hypothetical protein RL318_1898 [Fibrobacterota bacterium]|jgi:hypothetical protein
MKATSILFLSGLLALAGCKQGPSSQDAKADGKDSSFARDSLPWRVLTSAHYRIESLTDSVKTQELLVRVEILYQAFGRALELPEPRHAPLLNLRLYRDRHEMHSFESMPDWAEGIYRDGWCIQYLRPREANPWHWTIHEATHQLNAERAQLDLPRWLNEGLACLFSTSRLDSSGLHLGAVDPESYPVWWLKEYRPVGNRIADLRNGKLQSLETIVRGGGVVPESGDLNLAYLSWWTVTRFLWSRDPVRFFAWVKADRSVEGLERIVGSLKDLEGPYVRSMVDLTDSVIRSAGGRR